MGSEKQQADTASTPSTVGAWCALLVALAASAGSYWATVGMELVACPLCFYQRSLAFGIAAVLLIGLLTGLNNKASLSILALPMAAAGLAVAGFHVYLELSGKLECPLGLFDLDTVPKQSLTAFGLLTIVLLFDAFARRGEICCGFATVFGGLVLGCLIAAAFIHSAPQLPPPPDKPYDKPLTVCRPPYKG